MDYSRRGVKLWKQEPCGSEIGQVRADGIERALIDWSDCGLSQRTTNRYRSAMGQIRRRARHIPRQAEYGAPSGSTLF